MRPFVKAVEDTWDTCLNKSSVQELVTKPGVRVKSASTPVFLTTVDTAERGC